MQKSSRYHANKKYYSLNKNNAHKLSLLFAGKTRGRVPNLKTVEKYDITIAELVEKWRIYKSTKSHDEIPPLKIMKLQALILNMI